MKIKSFTILLLAFLLMPISQLLAEGSRDFYYSSFADGGTVPRGNRTRLASMMNNDGYNFNPYNTHGRHFVYAKAGEVIHMGSSSQGYGNGTIKLYSPTGVMYTSGNYTTVGRINNLAEELAGPKVNGSPATGYTPFSQAVTAETEGIWVIEFYAFRTGETNGTTESDNGNNLSEGTHPLNLDWEAGEAARRPTSFTTNDLTRIYSITAWDVTVQKTDNSFATGRLFTDVFNLITNATVQTAGTDYGINGFYGKIYTLTRDGFTYEINLTFASSVYPACNRAL